jgi:hypothetical protein
VGMPDWSKVRPGEAIAVRLGTLLDHPLLYKAYPDLPNINVKIYNSTLIKNEDDPSEEYVAATTPAEDGEPASIEIAGRACNFLSALVHEIQHVLEDYEDLDYGPDTAATTAGSGRRERATPSGACAWGKISSGVFHQVRRVTRLDN